MMRGAAAVAWTMLAAVPGAGVAAEYVPPPIMPIPTAWQGRAAAAVRILDKLDAHVETLTLRAGETGNYKSMSVTVRGCMDRPDGLPADSAAFLDVRDRHGDVPPFSGWVLSREPAIGVFESPIYAVQLVACDGEPAAPAAPPLPPPVPPPASLAPEDTAGDAGPGPGTGGGPGGGSSAGVDGPQGQAVDAPDAGDGGPGRAARPAAPPPVGATPYGDGTQPDPVYPDGPPPPQTSPPPAPP